MCLFVVTMLQEFADDPSEEAFHGLTKDQLLEVADIFKIEVSATEKRLKAHNKICVATFSHRKGNLATGRHEGGGAPKRALCPRKRVG